MRAINRRRVMAAMLLAGLATPLAGCATPAVAPVFEAPRWSDKAPLGLVGSRLEAVAGYQLPLGDPAHIETGLPLNLQDQALRWATERLRVAGGGAPVRFTVTEASARRRQLQTDAGITALFTDEQAQQVTLVLAARIEVLSLRGAVRARAEVRVSRATTLPESASPTARDQALYRLTRALLEDFDREMAARMRRHLGRFLVDA